MNTLSCQCYSGKKGLKIVSGYTKVNAQVILAGKSVGVHSFLPEYRKALVCGRTLSCLLITGSKECRNTLFLASITWVNFSVGVHSFLLVLVKCRYT